MASVKKEKKAENTKNIVIKKSSTNFDVFISDKNNLDYFCLRPDDYAKEDSELRKIIKNKTTFKLERAESNKIINTIRSNISDDNKDNSDEQEQ